MRALQWAADLARRTHGRLIALHAFVPEQSEKPPGVLERLRDERLEEVRAWCLEALEDCPHQVEVALELVEGDPRELLVDATERHGADLLVVATTGASGASPGLLQLGSVAEYAARNASVPLAVIPPDGPAHVERAVIAVDGSDHSRSAARWLAVLDRLCDGLDVVAVSVDEGGGLFGGEPTEPWADARKDVLRHEWVRDLEEQGIEFDSVVVDGMPAAEGILHAARRANADVVVLGMRGAGGFTGLRLGGVAFKVIRQTSLPVVLVPPDDLAA
jgi:nucleotide-binding universal stress UspA family protein